MKIAKRDIALVLVIFGLIAAFCGYKFFLSPNLEEVDKEKSAQADLQVKIDEVKAREAEVKNMEKEMQTWQVEIANAIKPFHSRYLYEDGIMYLNNLEKQKEAEGEDAFGVRIKTYTVAETNYGNTVEGKGAFAGSTYRAGNLTYSYDYTIIGYDDLKKFINYIVSEKDGSGVKSLDTMTFAVIPSEEKFTGNITMTVYAVTDGNNPYEPQDLSEVEQQIENNSIFGNLGEDAQ